MPSARNAPTLHVRFISSARTSGLSVLVTMEPSMRKREMFCMDRRHDRLIRSSWNYALMERCGRSAEKRAAAKI